jgi:hypothetical protein
MSPRLRQARRLPALGRAPPAEARQLVMAAWDHEVTDDGLEPLNHSQIRTLTFLTYDYRQEAP